jgi:hypothetical protein
VPVAADTNGQEQDTWTFYLWNGIMTPASGDSRVQINGIECGLSGEKYQKVVVPTTTDSVDVTFKVAYGSDTTVTVTKELIAELRKKGTYPFIAAWGGTLTYDVDAVAIIRRGDDLMDWKIYKHLYTRGLFHECEENIVQVREKLPWYDWRIRNVTS